MKYLKYLLIAIIGLFTAACAEEDPTSLGILNPKATVSNITATKATITVDLSDCAELLQGKEWDCRVDFIKGGERFAESWREDNISGNPFIRIFSFDDFQPATTYSFAIEITSVLGSWQSIYCRRDDFTFTTPALLPEKEYSQNTLATVAEIID